MMSSKIPSQKYLYQQVRAGVYERTCYGTENGQGMFVDKCEGLTHITTTAALRLPTDSLPGKFKSSAKDAWILMRYQVPGLASAHIRRPSPDYSGFRYIVPSSRTDLDKWIEQTVFFYDDVKSMHDRNTELRENVWWRHEGDHPVSELHVSPCEGGWQISLSLAHNITDARNSFALMDLYLEFLVSVLEGNATPVSELKWGEEVVRLLPTGCHIESLVKAGVLPGNVSPPAPKPADATHSDTPKSDIPQVSSPLIPWLYSAISVEGKGDITRLVTFSREATAQLHLLSKRRGCTVTQVFTALSMLAHTEMMLKAASSLGPQRFQEVFGAFVAATDYLVSLTFINQRDKLPGGYNSYKTPKGAPLFTMDLLPLFLPMSQLREMIQVHDEKSTAEIAHSLDEDLFWNGLVKNAVGVWNAVDRSLPAFAARQAVAQETLAAFDPRVLSTPTIVVSSVGDLSRLNLLAPYLPSANHKTLVVEDVVCSCRMRSPIIENLLWEYDGQIQCNLMTAAEHTTEESLRMMGDIMQQLVAEFFLTGAGAGKEGLGSQDARNAYDSPIAESSIFTWLLVQAYRLPWRVVSMFLPARSRKGVPA